MEAARPSGRSVWRGDYVKKKFTEKAQARDHGNSDGSGGEAKWPTHGDTDGIARTDGLEQERDEMMY